MSQDQRWDSHWRQASRNRWSTAHKEKVMAAITVCNQSYLQNRKCVDIDASTSRLGVRTTSVFAKRSRWHKYTRGIYGKYTRIVGKDLTLKTRILYFYSSDIWVKMTYSKWRLFAEQNDRYIPIYTVSPKKRSPFYFPMTPSKINRF